MKSSLTLHKDKKINQNSYVVNENDLRKITVMANNLKSTAFNTRQSDADIKVLIKPDKVLKMSIQVSANLTREANCTIPRCIHA